MDKLGGHEAASSVPSQAARHPKYITYSRLLLFLVSGDSCPIRGCSHGFQAEPCWYIVPRRKLVRTGTKIHRPHIYSNLCSAACSAKEKFNKDKVPSTASGRHYHSISARFIYHWLTTQLNYTSCYISLYAHTFPSLRYFRVLPLVLLALKLVTASVQTRTAPTGADAVL